MDLRGERLEDTFAASHPTKLPAQFVKGTFPRPEEWLHHRRCQTCFLSRVQSTTHDTTTGGKIAIIPTQNVEIAIMD